MALPYPYLYDYRNLLVSSGGPYGTDLCYDGTYVWVPVSVPSSYSLYRIRPSDCTFIGTSGASTTNASAVNAGVTTIGTPRGIATDGTYVAVASGNSNQIRIHLCSDMSTVTTITVAGITYLDGFSGAYSGGYFWFGSTTNLLLVRVTPGTWAVSTFASIRPERIIADGYGGIWVATGATSSNVGQYAAGGTQTRLVAVGSNPTSLAVGAGLLYIGCTNGWVYRIRSSDGAAVAWDGVTVNSPYSEVKARYYFLSTTPQALHADEDYLWVTWTVNASDAMARIRHPVSASSPNPIYTLRLYNTTGSNWNDVHRLLFDGTYLYSYDYSSNSGPQITQHLIVAPAAGTPTLASVTPMEGPKTRLVFDLAVDAGTPSLGPPAAGFGVTGVTQVDETTIDVETDYPPTHPIGTAEVPDVPSPPKGGGAFLV